MINHNRFMQKENDMLKDENQKLSCLVKLAQERLKDLSSSLQKMKVNVLPPITVCNEPFGQKKTEKVVPFFATTGKVSLDSTPLTLCENGCDICVGQKNGNISLLQISCSGQSSFCRFNAMPLNQQIEEDFGPIRKTCELHGHEGPVHSLQWYDNNSLTSVSLDSTLKIWDIETGKNQSHYINIPSVSHTVIDNAVLAASCTKNLVCVDPRDSNVSTLEMESPITSVASTSLGILLGTADGCIQLYDHRINKAYQSLSITTAKLPISKISGNKNVTVTSFDGIVRVIGKELPMYVERELSIASMNGSIIGSCLVSLADDDFVISGSTTGKAVIWKSSNQIQMIQHSGSYVYDCIPLSEYMGTFITCDDSKHITMYARSFEQYS